MKARCAGIKITIITFDDDGDGKDADTTNRIRVIRCEDNRYRSPAGQAFKARFLRTYYLHHHLLSVGPSSKLTNRS
jgi:hypothetical protein